MHYPPVVDVLDPYILLVHQGIVEGLFIDDMDRRRRGVNRNTAFESFKLLAETGKVQVDCRTNVAHDKKSYVADYMVGCE